MPTPYVPAVEIPGGPPLKSIPVLTETDGGFWRGFAGDRRSVFEAPAPLSEKIGAGVRAVGEFIADPLIELSNQYRDVYSAASGATGGWRSAFAQQVSDGSYGGAALTELGMAAGATPMVGAARKGLVWAVPAAGPIVESYAAKSGILAYSVDNGGLATGAARVADVAPGNSPRGGFVFRGDGRSPDVIFNEGLRPLGTSTDLHAYALQNEPSIFVSTSKSANVARDFADMQGGGYVYTVRVQPQGVDVNTVLGSRSPFPHEVEIAVPGGVNSTDIMGARLVGDTGRFVGPFIRNPLYYGYKP
ncbi:enterotoxin A family protein [Burkholderia sp. BCC1977]|uniref:scabin-related ADP-ribosyltransferase n=1 Tax=Burkholderia sp. BCC1977 TaxID=2817440 RepID=UPI002ABDB675|nr:enterotoxin A family protein [Burkholderia sp. BCC1977]